MGWPGAHGELGGACCHVVMCVDMSCKPKLSQNLLAFFMGKVKHLGLCVVIFCTFVAILIEKNITDGRLCPAL